MSDEDAVNEAARKLHHHMAVIFKSYEGAREECVEWLLKDLPKVGAIPLTHDQIANALRAAFNGAIAATVRKTN